MIKYDLKTCINKDEAYVIYTSSGLDWQRPKDDMHHPPSAFEFTLSILASEMHFFRFII